MDLSLVMALIAAVLALVAVAVLLRGRSDPVLKARADQLAERVENLLAAQNQLVGQLSQMAEGNAATQAQLTKTVQDRIDGLAKQLGDGLKDSSTKTAKTLGELHTRLNVIDEAQKNLTELSGQVVGLQDILANKQARGAFGEIQLADLVRNALPPSAYQFQAPIGDNRRADCLVKLPNPPGPIVIDAKFTLESYEALQAAETEADKTAARRAFAKAIQEHIKNISERYIVPGETAESALMFIPSEAVYAELHANFRDLVERSHTARVWIVSPTTLWATLHTVRAVLKDVRMREQAGVIQHQVGLLLQDVRRIDDRVGNLQRHFGQAEADIRQIRTSTDKVTARGERISEVELEEPDAAEPVVLERPKVVG